MKKRSLKLKNSLKLSTSKNFSFFLDYGADCKKKMKFVIFHKFGELDKILESILKHSDSKDSNLKKNPLLVYAGKKKNRKKQK